MICMASFEILLQNLLCKTVQYEKFSNHGSFGKPRCDFQRRKLIGLREILFDNFFNWISIESGRISPGDSGTRMEIE